MSKKGNGKDDSLVTLYDKGVSTSGGLVGTAYKHCGHTGRMVVWSHEKRGITLAGATGSSIDISAADLVIDAAGYTKKFIAGAAAEILTGTERYTAALRQHVVCPDSLFIEWTDRGVPNLAPEFWRDLWTMIPDGSRVVCACFGGHGRTGTAIACLIAAATAVPGAKNNDAASIIQYVRKQHCDDAIETAGQEDYIAKVVAQLNKPGNKKEFNRQLALVAGLNKKAETKWDLTKSQASVVISPAKDAASSNDDTMQLLYADEKVERNGESDCTEFHDDEGNLVDGEGDVIMLRVAMDLEDRQYTDALPSFAEYVASLISDAKN